MYKTVNYNRLFFKNNSSQTHNLLDPIFGYYANM